MSEGEQQARRELEDRWRRMFRTLAEGGEVPPSQRLRAEGMMETLVLLQLATESELQDAMAAAHDEHLGATLPEDWRELFPFPQIPGFGRRAPVYPSTGD